MAGVLLGLQLLLAPAARADAPAASGTPRAATPFKPADEFERLEFVGRAQPEVGSAGLLRYLQTLRMEEPRYLQALMELGSEYVRLNRGDDGEQAESSGDGAANGGDGGDTDA